MGVLKWWHARRLKREREAFELDSYRIRTSEVYRWLSEDKPICRVIEYLWASAGNFLIDDRARMDPEVRSALVGISTLREEIRRMRRGQPVERSRRGLEIDTEIANLLDPSPRRSQLAGHERSVEGWHTLVAGVAAEPAYDEWAPVEFKANAQNVLDALGGKGWQFTLQHRPGREFTPYRARVWYAESGVGPAEVEGGDASVLADALHLALRITALRKAGT